MKKWFNKQTITMFILGIVISSSTFVVAKTTLNVNPNPFPIVKDGEEVNIEGYNINNSTYLKLRDVAELINTKIEFNKTDKKIYIGNNNIINDCVRINYLDKFPAIKYNGKIYLSISQELQENLKTKQYKFLPDYANQKIDLINKDNNTIISLSLTNINQSVEFNGLHYFNSELITNYMSID